MDGNSHLCTITNTKLLVTVLSMKTGIDSYILFCDLNYDILLLTKRGMRCW